MSTSPKTLVENVDGPVSLAFHPDSTWQFQASGYFAESGYTCTHERELVTPDELAQRAGGVRGFVDVIRMSEERRTFNAHPGQEFFYIGRVPESDVRMMIRRVELTQPHEAGDHVELHSLCFASKTDTMLGMLRESNAVLEKFAFGTAVGTPDTWLSKYRRYTVGASEVVVSRLRPNEVVSSEELERGDWCTACGLGRESEVLRSTPRVIAGAESTEISFRRTIGGKVLFGTRLCVPRANEWFIFQLLASEQDYGIERGRLEGVLNTARFVQATEKNEQDGDARSTCAHRAEESEPNSEEARLSSSATVPEIEPKTSAIDRVEASHSSSSATAPEVEAETSAIDLVGSAPEIEAETQSEVELLDISPIGVEQQRKALLWREDHLRPRVRLEMYLMLLVLAEGVQDFDLEPTAKFMDMNTGWVVSNLFGDDQVEIVLAEQQEIFEQAFQRHLAAYKSKQSEDDLQRAVFLRLAKSTSLAKARVQAVILRTGARMYIGTLARVAVALQCPLFGFETGREVQGTSA